MTKKIVTFFILCMLCILCTISFTACNETVKETSVNDFVFEETGNGYAITNYKGTDNIVKIPSKYNGKYIYTIKTKAFSYCIQVESIILPDSIIEIEDSAFFLCNTLNSILVPKNLKNFSSYKFHDCSNLAIIYYKGTKTEWTTLLNNSGYNTSAFNFATIYYYSETEPTTKDKYWHYKNNEIAVWDSPFCSQSKSITFNININNSPVNQVTSTNYLYAYFDTICNYITAPVCIDKANEIYLNKYSENGHISTDFIVTYSNAMTLTISYFDYNANDAANKLDAYIKAIQYTVPSLFEFDIEIIVLEN
ncbi:MAG: leucine-rich repeat protein [Clostridia bacterium]|nr:leucine-rich repeat protein [Clostridia bacterium]